jgi:hypothetical protein
MALATTSFANKWLYCLAYGALVPAVLFFYHTATPTALRSTTEILSTIFRDRHCALWLYALCSMLCAPCLPAGRSALCPLLLLRKTSRQVFPVQAGNMRDGYVLWAFHLTGTGICAGAKAKFVHFSQHAAGTLFCLDPSLWKFAQV